MFQNLFNALVRKKQHVLRIFQVVWVILGIGLILASRSVFDPDTSSYIFWYDVALLLGKTALIFFIITLSPGIFKRFGIRNRILGLIMIFRRQFGITMFLLAAFHGLTVSLLPKFKNGIFLQYANFELFGLSAVILLFLLFLTSNDISQMKLGKFWYLLHRLVYIIMWLILFHVAIQRLSIWTVLASILVVAEMAGIFYSNFVHRYKN